jgi:hypothetical protein
MLALVLAACSQEAPTGQVLARVDDVEITRRDVLIELIASGAPADVDAGQVQPELLDRIIARKLLAEEARRRSIDRSPEFLGAERRSREIILGELLIQRLVGRLPPPSETAIARFVSQNAARFDRNRRLRISRLVTNEQHAPLLQAAPSVEAMAARLHEEGRPFARSVLDVDSAALPVDEATVLQSAGGRPVMTASDRGRGTQVLAEQVMSATARPLDESARGRITATILRGAMERQLIDRTMRQLRSRARLAFQPGLQPPP